MEGIYIHLISKPCHRNLNRNNIKESNSDIETGSVILVLFHLSSTPQIG